MNSRNHTLALIRSVVVTTVPFLLAGVLITAAITKIISLEHFSRLTSTIQIVPLELRRPLAFAVPFVELCVACLLLLRQARNVGLYFSIAVLTVFTAFLVYQSTHPYIPDCHCFGLIKLAKDAQTETRLALLRNTVLLLLAVAALSLSGRQPRRLANASSSQARVAHATVSAG
jgi:hypothetical protein